MGRGVKAPGSSSQIEDHPPPGILFGVVPSFLIVYWEMARGFGSWNWGEGVCQLGRWGTFWSVAEEQVHPQKPGSLGSR